jgi:bifunctional enzyme CysN/CysC
MKGLLKFITCGSVDDGKSTLIGHMLYDAKLLFADQKDALILDSKVGSRGGEIDYSLLLDGLMAEREQGITIDVAYRYFTTSKRSFIVADTPGHEEYTRNMAVGASFAELAIILVDATQGILVQTRRHARICSLMGIRHFVFALNKMDLVHYDKSHYEKLAKDVKKLAVDLELANVEIIPVSATEGDNVNTRSAHMTWYKGSTILEYLENVDVDDAKSEEGFVLPVQRVCRPDHTFRGFQGKIASGTIAVGDEVQVLPSKEKAVVKSILVADKESNEAYAGQPVTVLLNREIDVSRGCVIVKDTELKIANLFSATLLWMDDVKLVKGKSFLLRVGTKKIPATVMEIKYRIDINTGEHMPAKNIYKNEIIYCDIATAEPIVFDKFARHQAVGSFIMIDRVSNMTSACGIIEHSLRRSENIVWQKMDVTREIRSNNLGQKPVTVWFTGLSGSGKSTLANEIEKRLSISGKHTMALDGDNIRMGLNKNLGFEEADRIENIRRIAEVAKLMNDAGLIVLTSFISPYEADRRAAREIVGVDNFVEVYVSTPLEECERRDVKGLYKKARSGEIPNFTGISSKYQVPENADICVDTSKMSLEDAADYIINCLADRI